MAKVFVSVEFVDGLNRKEYTYVVDTVVHHGMPEAGWYAVVDTPTRGYALVKVKRVLQEAPVPGIDYKHIVAFVFDGPYLALKAQQAKEHERARAVKARIAKLGVNELEELLAIYEDA
jgi:hypothetical protein